MGNAVSNSGCALAMSAVAKTMQLTKPQVMEIRKACAAMASKDGQIRRKLFHIGLAKAGLSDLDTEILDLLFTMWDEVGDNRVPYMDFVVGIAPLACRYENMASALKFVLQVMDDRETGSVDSNGLIMTLKSINNTASYFGDSLLSENQIYKLADSVFDTITMISSDSDSIGHTECLQILLHEPLLDQLMSAATKRKAIAITTTASVAESAVRGRGPRSVTFADWKQRAQEERASYEEPAPFARTRLERYDDEETAFTDATDMSSKRYDDNESAFSTDVSSIMLTPLNRVPISTTVSSNSIRLTPMNRIPVSSAYTFGSRSGIETPLNRIPGSANNTFSSSSGLLTPMNRIPVPSNTYDSGSGIETPLNRIPVPTNTTSSSSGLLTPMNRIPVPSNTYDSSSGIETSLNLNRIPVSGSNTFSSGSGLMTPLNRIPVPATAMAMAPSSSGSSFSYAPGRVKV